MIAAHLSESPARLPKIEPILAYGDLRLEGNHAHRGQQRLHLTPGSLDLLRLFLENPGKSYTAAQIERLVIGAKRSPAAPRRRISDLRAALGDSQHTIIRYDGIGWGIGL